MLPIEQGVDFSLEVFLLSPSVRLRGEEWQSGCMRAPVSPHNGKRVWWFPRQCQPRIHKSLSSAIVNGLPPFSSSCFKAFGSRGQNAKWRASRSKNTPKQQMMSISAMVQGCILFKGPQNFLKTEYLGPFCPKIQNTHQFKLHKISGFIEVQGT